ncbi:hypothetical protein ACFWCB_04445 [Streptomyces sp. NPDC060048]|uniref:hypothetical protein n=1 Tax=unclassified Streptomyces TaxID=2593676 RepID=UPI0036C4FF85
MRGDAVQGKENKRQEPGKGREEQAQEHPGPDPVHPEASKPVAGKGPDEMRIREQRMRTRERKTPEDQDGEAG